MKKICSKLFCVLLVSLLCGGSVQAMNKKVGGDKTIYVPIDETSLSGDEYMKEMFTRIHSAASKETGKSVEEINKEVEDNFMKKYFGETCECEDCDKPAVLQCSRCKSVKYCNKECQLSDWGKHKKKCKKISK